jgi:Icc protein
VIAATDRSRRYRLLHLSDTHLTASGFDEDGIDASGSLRRMMTDVQSVESLDAVIVSGDVADDGSQAGCSAVLSEIGAVARARRVPHIYSIGNHDDRDNFAAVFGSGHRSADGEDIGTPMSGSGERAAYSFVDGLRIITLDSLVPGAIHGALSADQLEWLRSVLHERAPDGSVLVLHHPPIYVSGHPFRDHALRDPEALARVLPGTDVLAILCGHLHTQVTGMLAGVPVIATPGVLNRVDVTVPKHLVRGVLGAGATVVDLGGPGTPMSHVLHAQDPAAGRQAYLYDMDAGVFLSRT